MAALGLDEGADVTAQMMRGQLPGVAQAGLALAIGIGDDVQPVGNLLGAQVAVVDPPAGEQPLGGPLSSR